MRIVHISDTHGRYPKWLPEGDVLVHSGDLVLDGRLEEYPAFVNWVRGFRFPHVVVIPGNHDEAAERQEGAWRDTLAGIPGVSVLINQGVEISGVSFWGSPYTPQFMDWSFMLPPDRLAAVWEQIPSCDVLVTHGPPHRVLDAATRSRRVEHVGCPILARRVQLLQPKLHLYGHIHPAYGVREFGETRCLNSSVVDDCLDLIHGAQVVEI